MKSILLEGGQGNGWLYIIIIVAFFAVLIVPSLIRNKKENARRQETMSQLKTGDAIITTAGVFGKIVSMRETTIGRVFVIETGDSIHKSYQEIHADAIMGVDNKKDIVLDAEGNDITFQEEDKKIEEEQNNQQIENENKEANTKSEKNTSKTKSSSRNRKKKTNNK